MGSAGRCRSSAGQACAGCIRHRLQASPVLLASCRSSSTSIAITPDAINVECLASSGGGGDEQLDPELLADFKELVKKTKREGVQKVLRRNKVQLVRHGAVSEEALQGLTKEDLTKQPFNLLHGDAATLKLVFPSPKPAGVCNLGVLPGSLAWDVASGHWGEVQALLVEAQLTGAAGRQRRPISDIDNQFAQQLFMPFPPGTVPRQLVWQSVQALLFTPPATQLHDPENVLCHTPALQLLFADCITQDAGGEGVVDLSDASAGEVYSSLRHVAKVPLKPATATDVAWAGWWANASEAVIGIAEVHARVPVSSDRGVVESTLTTRDQVVWLNSVVLLTGDASGPTHPLSSAEEAAAQHEGASAALYGQLGWVLHYQAAGSRIQLYIMPCDKGGICYPITDILDVSLPRPRADLLLVLLNLMRLAATIAKAQWLPSAPGMRLYKPIERPSPYPAPADIAASGYTVGKKVQVTVRKQTVVKEYQAPGWALEQNLRVYEAIQAGRIPHTVEVKSLMVDGEAHESSRPYAQDAWFHVRIVMSPAAYQRNPKTPAELWELLLCLLEMLVALHGLALVHRDLRLPNVYRFGDSWLVSDWELAAPAGLQLPYKIRRLPEEVKSGRELYTYHHDLWQVAEIIKELRRPAASSLRNCAAAAAFARLLVEPQMTADRALEDLNLFKHTWL